MFILSCSTQKPPIRYSADVVDRKIAHSIHQDSPVFSRFENVKLFIDSLNIAPKMIEFGIDEVRSAVCQVLIDENAKIVDIYFHQSAGSFIETKIISILNSSIFKSYKSKDSNNMQKYSLILPFYIVQDRILSPYKWKSSKNSNKKSQPKDENIVPFGSPPMPIGGFQKIQENLIYPEIARKAGIQGKIIINALINEQGFIEDFTFLESDLFELNHVAVMALLSVKWKPAFKEGRPQKIWAGIPIIFRLR